MDWVCGMSSPSSQPRCQAATLRASPMVSRDLAQVIVGEMVAVAAELPGQSALAEPLATGGWRSGK